MLSETERNQALARLYSGGYPSQVAVEALMEWGMACPCGYRTNWMALQVVVPEGGPSRQDLQEYQYWQAVIASLNTIEYSLKCYNCAAIEKRSARLQRIANKKASKKAQRIYVYPSPVNPAELPELMSWAEDIRCDVFLTFEGEVWKYRPREKVDRPDLVGVDGYKNVKDK